MAAGQILAAVMRLFGLQADADRIMLLRPLAATLLREGASLSATVDPSLEPLAMGGIPPDTVGGTS